MGRSRKVIDMMQSHASRAFNARGHCISRRITLSHLIQNDVRHAFQLHGTCQTPQENPCCAEKQAGSPASASLIHVGAS